MTWWGWLLLGVCLLGCVIAFREIAWWSMNDMSSIDGEDIVIGCLLGLLLCWLWPLGAVWVLARRVLGPDDVMVLLMPRREWRRQKIEAQQRRIADLERELQIR